MMADINILGSVQEGLSPLSVDNTVAVGARKLMQRAIILLFTDSNDQYSLGYGSNMPEIEAGSINDVDSVGNLLTIAGSKVRDQLLSLDDPTDVPEARLRDLQVLLRPTADGGRAVVVSIVTLAGTTLEQAFNEEIL